MASKLYITHVPPPIAIYLWGEIEPLLEKALEHAQGEFNSGYLREMVYKGSMIVILIFNDMELIAAAAVERISYPAKSTMRISLLGGEGMDEWLKPLVQYLDQMAFSWGVNDIEIAGRRGWLRALDQHGYEATYTILNKKLKSENPDAI